MKVRHKFPTVLERRAMARASVRTLDCSLHRILAAHAADVYDQERYKTGISYIIMGLAALEASFLTGIPPYEDAK